MNEFANFDEIPSRTLQDIKETKRNRRKDVQLDGQRENSTYSHPQTQFAGGIIDLLLPFNNREHSTIPRQQCLNIANIKSFDTMVILQNEFMEKYGKLSSNTLLSGLLIMQKSR